MPKFSYMIVSECNIQFEIRKKSYLQTIYWEPYIQNLTSSFEYEKEHKIIQLETIYPEI